MDLVPGYTIWIILLNGNTIRKKKVMSEDGNGHVLNYIFVYDRGVWFTWSNYFDRNGTHCHLYRKGWPKNSPCQLVFINIACSE